MDVETERSFRSDILIIVDEFMHMPSKEMVVYLGPVQDLFFPGTYRRQVNRIPSG